MLEKDDAEMVGWHERAVSGLAEVMGLVESESWQKKEGWTEEARHASLPFAVYSKAGVQKKGKTFMGTAEYEVSVEAMLADLWDGTEAIPTWNSDLYEYRRVLRVGKQTDLTYNAFKELGIISSRDFLNVRTYRWLGPQTVVMVGCATTWSGCGAVKGRVRGEDSPGIAHVQPLPDKPGHILYTFSSNTDLKGYLPKKLTDSVMHKTMMDYFVRLHDHIKADLNH